MGIGILAGLAAGALWGLTFVAPRLVAPFTPFDLAVLRNVVFALVSVPILIALAGRLPRLGARQIGIALWLGLLGYAGYYLFVAYASHRGGSAIAALVIGCLPIALAIVGNLRRPALPWRRLALPLTIILAGLAVVNLGSIAAPHAGRLPADILAGFLLACGGLACWLIYAVINSEALERHPSTDTTLWTCWQGIGSGLAMLAILPFGAAFGGSQLPSLPLFGGEAQSLWFWAIITGAFSSWIATFAWVMASRRLSLALSAQLIVSETLFGLFYGFLFEHRWPDAHEWLGGSLLIGGVMLGIRLFGRRPEPPAAPALS